MRPNSTSATSSSSSSASSSLSPAERLALLKKPPRINVQDVMAQRTQWAAPHSTQQPTPTPMPPPPPTHPIQSTPFSWGQPNSGLDRKLHSFTEQLNKLNGEFKNTTGHLSQHVTEQIHQNTSSPFTQGGSGGGGAGGVDQQKNFEMMRGWLQNKTSSMTKTISDFSAFSNFAVRKLKDDLWSRENEHEAWAKQEDGVYDCLSSSAARMLQLAIRVQVMKINNVTEIWSSYAPLATLNEHMQFSKQFDRLLSVAAAAPPQPSPPPPSPGTNARSGLSVNIFKPHLIVQQLIVEDSIPRIFALATIGDTEQCPQQAVLIQFQSPTSVEPQFKERCLLVHDLQDYYQNDENNINFRTRACKMIKHKKLLGVVYTKENVQQQDPKSECFYRLFDFTSNQFVSSSPILISAPKTFQIVQDALFQVEHDLLYVLTLGESFAWNIYLIQASTGEPLTNLTSLQLALVPSESIFLPVKLSEHSKSIKPAKNNKTTDEKNLSTMALLGTLEQMTVQPIHPNVIPKLPFELSCWYSPTNKKIQCHKPKKIALVDPKSEDNGDDGTVRYYKILTGNGFELTFQKDLKTTHVKVGSKGKEKEKEKEQEKTLYEIQTLKHWQSWGQHTKITGHVLVSDRYVVLVGKVSAFETKSAACYAVIDLDKLAQWWSGEIAIYNTEPVVIRVENSISSELTDVVCCREDPPETFHLLMSGFKRTSHTFPDHCSFFLSTKIKTN